MTNQINPHEPLRSDQLLDNAISKAFAPLIARQEEVELNTLARLEASIKVDDLIPDQIIENAVHDALAPLLARQDSMEKNTDARLDSLQALVSSLASIVKEVFRPNNNTDTQPLSSAPSSPHAIDNSFGGSEAPPTTTAENLSCSNSPCTPVKLTASPPVFSCNICGKTFDVLTSLDNHCRATHPLLQCKTCHQTLRSIPDLNLHLHRNHSYKNCSPDLTVNSYVLSCPINPSLVLQETLDNAGQCAGELMCSLCDDRFIDNYVLIVHLSEQHSITSYYACALCRTIFLTQAKLDRHLQQEHDLQYTAFCGVCDFTFQNKSELDRHIELNHAATVISANQVLSSSTCDFCESTFPSFENLEAHIMAHHCEETSWHSASLSGTGSEALPGSLLTKTGGSENEYINVKDDDPTDDPALCFCYKCDKLFESTFSLEEHVQQVHTQVPANCYRGETFLSYEELDRPCSPARNSDEENEIENAPDPFRLPQLDGNETISSMDTTVDDNLPSTLLASVPPQPSNNLGDPSIISAGGSCSSYEDVSFQLLYSLNSVNQARRLLENTTRPAFDIRSNNPQTINGQQYPTNVSID